MPYIPKEKRFEAMADPKTLGELNYKITEACIDFIEEQSGGLTYDNVNNVIGVLDCAKMELYRRVAGPYEDNKCAENGDVYPAELLTE